MAGAEHSLLQHDLELTVANRERLRNNVNLMYWYEQLYAQLFGQADGLAGKKILEIGSGTSPLKQFFPSVITSDVLPLDYLDLVFDCHKIAELDSIGDHSLDVITLTNVLHHLRDPIQFLRSATTKLRPGGNVYIVEPYLSVMSYPMYRLLHPEPVDLSIKEPVLGAIEGPLSTSNQAIPYMIFFSRRDWLHRLTGCYDLSATKITHYTALSYMATGGISRRFPIPATIYRAAFRLDRALASAMPRLFASFFEARLTSSEPA